MTPVRLSICMPTYNFGAFIGETLDSIVAQMQPGVEVIVFDGGSTDGTEAAVRAFTRAHPQISYVRQEFRGGIDRDMARSVEIARGEYCWLFSSDDVMKPGALVRVLAEIDSGLDLYLCGLTLCDKRMRVIVEHPVSTAAWGSVFDLRDPEARARYFAAARTTTAFFSFMGSLVFRRSRWQEQLLEEAYIGSCWAHVVRFLRMIPRGLQLKFLGESLQLKRGDNDSFMDKGVLHRYSMAIDGFQRIAADVFGDKSIEARHVRRVLTNEFTPRQFFFVKLACARNKNPTELAELDRLVRTAYRDVNVRNVVFLASYRLLPVCGYELLRAVYRGARRLLHGR